jgi:hypothetical protein
MSIPKQGELMVEIWRLTNSEKLKVILTHVNFIRKSIFDNSKLAVLTPPTQNNSFIEYTEEEILPLFPDEILSRINYLSNYPNFVFLFEQDLVINSKNVSTGTISSDKLIINEPKNIILYLFEHNSQNRWNFRFANITEHGDEIQMIKREEKINEILNG